MDKSPGLTSRHVGSCSHTNTIQNSHAFIQLQDLRTFSPHETWDRVRTAPQKAGPPCPGSVREGSSAAPPALAERWLNPPPLHKAEEERGVDAPGSHSQARLPRFYKRFPSSSSKGPASLKAAGCLSNLTCLTPDFRIQT